MAGGHVGEAEGHVGQSLGGAEEVAVAGELGQIGLAGGADVVVGHTRDRLDLLHHTPACGIVPNPVGAAADREGHPLHATGMAKSHLGVIGGSGQGLGGDHPLLRAAGLAGGFGGGSQSLPCLPEGAELFMGLSPLLGAAVQALGRHSTVQASALERQGA